MLSSKNVIKYLIKNECGDGNSHYEYLKYVREKELRLRAKTENAFQINLPSITRNWSREVVNKIIEICDSFLDNDEIVVAESESGNIDCENEEQSIYESVIEFTENPDDEAYFKADVHLSRNLNADEAMRSMLDNPLMNLAGYITIHDSTNERLVVSSEGPFSGFLRIMFDGLYWLLTSSSQKIKIEILGKVYYYKHAFQTYLQNELNRLIRSMNNEVRLQYALTMTFRRMFTEHLNSSSNELHQQIQEKQVKRRRNILNIIAKEEKKEKHKIWLKKKIVEKKQKVHKMNVKQQQKQKQIKHRYRV